MRLAKDVNTAVYILAVEEHPFIHLSNKSLLSDLTGNEDEDLKLLDVPEATGPDSRTLKILEDGDPNIRLVDPAERRWVVLPRCMITASSCLLNMDNTIRYGYIIGKGQVLLGIYLVQESHPCEFTDLVYKYYVLGVLARARCLDEELPWHLAVAKRAHAGVENSMI